MRSSQYHRRDFNKLSMAALGGLMTGTAIGCSGKKDEQPAAGDTPEPPAETAEGDAPAAGDEMADAHAIMMAEPHVCRGLNACMGKGSSKDNACAGQGVCATAEAHGCHTQNACKGQGGCGTTAGKNSCKGKGECAVPLSEAAWTKARAAFEKAMTAAEKEFGEAPPKS